MTIDPSAGPATLASGAIIAGGGLCAPMAPHYNFGVDFATGGAHNEGMTMTEISEATIAAHTCRNCGEEFATIAEKVDHPCDRGLGASAQARLNAWLDNNPEGAAIREVENLHRDVVARLSEADAATMLHQLILDRQAERDGTRQSAIATDAGREFAAQHAAEHAPFDDGADTPLLRNAFPNRYAGECRLCGNSVPAQGGYVERDSSSAPWTVRHAPGRCQRRPARTVEIHGVSLGQVPSYAPSDGEFHSCNGEIYRVRVSRQGHPYAQRANVCRDEVEWIYVGRSPFGSMSTATLLTWEQARDFGLLTNRCVRCSRTLTDVRSIAQGYGPDCAAHMGWPTLTTAEAESVIAERTSR